MEFTYQVIQNEITDDTEQKHITYGIGLIGSSGVSIRSIPNIFLDKGAAEHTVKLFNEFALSPEHFDDAVEDVLTEACGIFWEYKIP